MATLPRHLTRSALAQEMVSREVLGDHQRTRVLDAATVVFAKRGYQGTTMEALYAGGRVGAGNFYALFESKEGCFLAAFDLAVDRTLEKIASAAADADDWAEQTYLGLRALLAALLESPFAGRLVLLEAQSAGEAGVARYNGLLEAANEWIARGRDPGGPDLPPSYEHAAIPGLSFYLQQCALDPRSHDLDTLTEETSTLLLEPMIGRERLAAVRRTAAAHAR